MIASICGLYLGLYLGLASLINNSYYQHVLTIIAIFAVLGLSWNILGGYAGVVSFGHAAFFGLGAFTVTLLLSACNLTPWLGIPAALLVSRRRSTVSPGLPQRCESLCRAGKVTLASSPHLKH
jgi:branched-chain amino acid transport system permease protein